GGYGRMRLDERVPLAPGDRLVLRDPGERDTVGGAEVVDAAPSGRARDALAYLPLPLEQRLLAGHRWLAVGELGPRAGLGAAEAGALVDALEKAPFWPPEPASAGGDPALVRSLVREGALVDLDGIVFASSAVDEARRRVRSALRDRGTVTVADVRDLLGSTRKY